MQRDYYAFRQIALSDSLGELAQAAQRLDQAKQIRDSDERRRARQDAENDLSRAANQAVQIEPHLAYLWFEAKGSDLDNAIRDAWQKKLASSAIPQTFDFLPDDNAIYQMPAFSFLLRVPFRLRKPYLSKDDTTFHLLDNPVRKEKIFQVPMVAATGWKGSLRAAMLYQLVEWWSSLSSDKQQQHIYRKLFVKRRIQLARLFGNEKGVQTDDTSFEEFLDTFGGKRQAQYYRRVVRRYFSSSGFFAGRLHFFATFFDQIGLEVINPHSRQSGVGERGPILMECVPQGTTGTLLLLYVPFGSPDRCDRAQDLAMEVAQDLEVTVQGLQAMLTTYGFGAKTSSGFGVVEEQLAGQGKLLIRAALSAPDAPVSTQTAPSAPTLARYLETPTRLHADFRRSDGSLKSAAEYEALIKSQGRQYSKQERQLYEKAQKWWDREGRQLAEAAAKEPVEQPAPVTPSEPPVTERRFTTLSGLQEQTQQVAEQLRNGGEG
jgi:CRISPR-associated protein Cmr2